MDPENEPVYKGPLFKFHIALEECTVSSLYGRFWASPGLKRPVDPASRWKGYFQVPNSPRAQGSHGQTP